MVTRKRSSEVTAEEQAAAVDSEERGKRRYRDPEMRKMIEVADVVVDKMKGLLTAFGGDPDNLEESSYADDSLAISGWSDSEEVKEVSAKISLRLQQRWQERNEIELAEAEKLRKIERRVDKRPELTRGDMAKIIRIIVKLDPKMTKTSHFHRLLLARENEALAKMEEAGVADFYTGPGTKKSRLAVALDKLANVMQRTEDTVFSEKALGISRLTFRDKLHIIRIHYKNSTSQEYWSIAAPLKIVSWKLILDIYDYLSRGRHEDWKPNKVFREHLETSRNNLKKKQAAA